MVERWSSKPYVWVRFLLLLFMFNLNPLIKLKNKLLLEEKQKYFNFDIHHIIHQTSTSALHREEKLPRDSFFTGINFRGRRPFFRKNKFPPNSAVENMKSCDRSSQRSSAQQFRHQFLENPKARKLIPAK